MYKQTIFLRGKSYTCGVRRDDHIGAPPSLAWCCPVCGDIWARALIQRVGQAPRRFMFLTAVCEDHRDPLIPSFAVSGSLLHSINADFNDSLPAELWEREFFIHETHLRKNYHDTEPELV